MAHRFNRSVFSLAWGVFVSYPFAMKLFRDITLWENADIGYKKALFKKLVLFIAVESVEIFGFITLIYLMVII